MPVLNLTLMVLQVLCGIVVLGLSVTLAKEQTVGSVPSQVGFSCFTGALGIIVALLGVVTLFFDSIPHIASVVADAASSAVYLAGGVVRPA